MNAERNPTNRTGVPTLVMQDRKLLELRGVTDVLRFDEASVTLSTENGRLTVEGNDLHVRVLNLEQGLVSLDGRIDALLYEDPAMNPSGEKSSFFGKLFR